MPHPVIETQHGIIRYAEAMAQVLAEAGRASHDALGDPPTVAVHKWSNVILKRALEILQEDRRRPRKEDVRLGNKLLEAIVEEPPK